MANRLAYLGAVVLISSCANEGRKAEEEYAIVSRGDSNVASCVAAEKVRDAYLKDKNEQEYLRWARRADAMCAMSRIVDNPSVSKVADDLEKAADEAATVRLPKVETIEAGKLDVPNNKEVPVCDRPDSAEKFALMNEIGVDCRGE